MVIVHFCYDHYNTGAMVEFDTLSEAMNIAEQVLANGKPDSEGRELVAEIWKSADE